MTENQDTPAPKQKQCFVVMGFGVKTDLATGRKLNLDKSYQALIKPVVEAKGIQCMRADEIKHSGTIDVPMFQELFAADMVIADLSTANVNAFYELGVRHALRPHTTIIMSEEQMTYPFDVNHITINRYTHLGDSIDYFEVLRFQKVLGETIDAVLNSDDIDSPVYTFLNDLLPPSLRDKAESVARQVNEALSTASPVKPDDTGSQTLALLVKQAEDSIGAKQYELAKGLLNSAVLMSQLNGNEKPGCGNSYLIQRLALATYKAKQPSEIDALNNAMDLLGKIDLAHTNDPETVALAGAIEKKLYESGAGDVHIDNAVLFFQRGYFLLHNRYNAINLGYLLLCRATSTLEITPDDKIADTVWGRRVYQDVLALCDRDWQQITDRKEAVANAASPTEIQQISATQKGFEDEQKFWILVNRAEAYYSMGNQDEYEKAKTAAAAIDHDDWMMESFTQQIGNLSKRLGK